MERLQDDIDEKADKFGKVTYYEAYLYASEAQKAAVAAGNISTFDSRKLKLAKASPYLAEYGTLPPQPSVDDEVYEIMDKNLASEATDLLNKLHENEVDESENVEAIVFTDEDGNSGASDASDSDKE